MTGLEFRAALKALGMTQRAFARRFGLLDGSISRWVVGERAVPSWVPPVLELLTEVQHPADIERIWRAARASMEHAVLGEEHLSYMYDAWIALHCEELLYEDLYQPPPLGDDRGA